MKQQQAYRVLYEAGYGPDWHCGSKRRTATIWTAPQKHAVVEVTRLDMLLTELYTPYGLPDDHAELGEWLKRPACPPAPTRKPTPIERLEWSKITEKLHDAALSLHGRCWRAEPLSPKIDEIVQLTEELKRRIETPAS